MQPKDHYDVHTLRTALRLTNLSAARSRVRNTAISECPTSVRHNPGILLSTPSCIWTETSDSLMQPPTHSCSSTGYTALRRTASVYPNCGLSPHIRRLSVFDGGKRCRRLPNPNMWASLRKRKMQMHKTTSNHRITAISRQSIVCACSNLPTQH